MVGTLPPSRKLHAAESSVQQAVETLLEIFCLFGFDSVGFSTAKTVTHYESLCAATGKSGDDAWMPVLKFKLAAFRQLALRDLRDEYDVWVPVVGLPSCPFASKLDNPRVLLGGKAYRWLRKQLATWPRSRIEEFCDTVAKAGRGMNRPGRRKMDDSARDTFLALTRSEPVSESPVFVISWADLAEHPGFAPTRSAADVVKGLPASVDSYGTAVELSLSPTTLSAQVRRTVMELFDGKAMDPSLWEEPMFPSTSANYVQGRAQAGAVGHISGWLLRARDADRKESVELGLDPADDLTFSPSELLKVSRTVVSEGLSRERYDPPHLKMIRSHAVLQRIKQYPGSRPKRYVDEHAYEAAVQTHVRWDVDSSRLRQLWSWLMDDMWEEAERELPTAIPVPLAEALKVRVITKGPPALMTVLRPLQKKLWQVLFEHRAFRLIGEPVSEGYILERMGAKLAGREFYLSGDYKDATNGLRSYLSEACADELSRCLELEPQQAFLFRRALTGHVLEHHETGERLP